MALRGASRRRQRAQQLSFNASEVAVFQRCIQLVEDSRVLLLENRRHWRGGGHGRWMRQGAVTESVGEVAKSLNASAHEVDGRNGRMRNGRRSAMVGWSRALVLLLMLL